MKEQKVFFKNSRSQRLCGLLALQSKRVPMIVMIHGMGPMTDKHEFKEFDYFAPKLYQAGFSVFRFDLSGHGESEGEHVDVTLDKYTDDLKHAIDFASKQDISKIGILANSFGCTVTVNLNDPRVDAIVLNSPAQLTKKIMERVFSEHNKNWRKEFKERGYYIYQKRATKKPLKVGMGLYTIVDKFDSKRKMSKVKAPILITSGAKDNYIRPSETKAIFDIANEPKKLIFGKDADHCFHNKESFIIKVMIDWFKKYLK